MSESSRGGCPSLLALPEFYGPRWQLPDWPSLEERLLFGWRSLHEREDGVPESARALISALCSVANLTFPSLIRVPLGNQLLRRHWRSGRHFRWLTTSDVSEASAGIFDASGFDWAQQGQLVFLSEGGGPPKLEDRHLHGTTGWEDPTAELKERGVTGILLPGVDGSVAALYGLLPGLSSRLLKVLREHGANVLFCGDAGSFAEQLKQ